MSNTKATNKSVHPTVVLSGPTSGLGRALFNKLLSEGYPTVGIGRNLKRIADVVQNAPVQGKLVELDLGVTHESLLVLSEVMQEMGSADTSKPLVFISNASIINPIGRATELTYSGLEHSMRINCIAPLMLANLLSKIAQEQARKLIVVNISSGAAHRPIRGWQAYCSSKSACQMGLDVLAAESSHVQAIHFDPGVMNTPMQEQIRAQDSEDMPEVEIFQSYQEKGVLKDPVVVAKEVVKLLVDYMS